MAEKKPSGDKAGEEKKAEPKSGKRKKGGPTMAELAEELRVNAEGLEGEALEREIAVIVDYLVEKSARMVPEQHLESTGG